MGNLRYWCACLFLAYFSLTVQAETIPATSGTYEPTLGPWTDNLGKGYSEATIDALAVKVNDFYFGGRGVYTGAVKVTKTNYKMVFTYGGSTWNNLTANTSAICPNGGSYSGSTELCTGNTCPSGQNWTLNGTTCTRPDCAAGQTRNAQGICESPCKAGQTRVNGVCQCDNGAQTGTDGSCCPVAGEGGGAPMQWCFVDNLAATTCDSAGTNGCKVRCNNVTFQKGTGNAVQIFPKQALGQSCSYTGTRATDQGGGPLNNEELNEVSKATKDPAKAKTPEGCLASGQGYVTSGSGITTCVGGGDTGVKKTSTENKTTSDNGQNSSETKSTETTQGPNGETTTKETTTKTNPDGSTTTTTKTTTRNPDGTVTEETTTQQKDPAGNTTGNKNDKANTTEDTFCQKNPDSVICKKDPSKFTGSCSSGFECSGDAATCAIARASWESRCAFSPDETTSLYDSENPGGTAAQNAAAEKALNKDGSSDFNIWTAFQGSQRNYISMTSGCPAGKTEVPLPAGRTLTIDATIVCQIGDFIRLLVHLLAYMAVIRLFATKLV